jgi:hypothetical protein
MGLIKLLFGERKLENEGFSSAYETSFAQDNSAVHQEAGTLASVQYDVDSQFFINPEQKIAYMVGNVKNRKVSVPNFEDYEAELKEQLDGIDSQRIFAYSECGDGTAILTGNLGIEALNALFGGVTLRISNELFIDGKILRNVEQRNLDRILRSHKNYVFDLEIVSDPKLAEKLAETYTELNNYLTRV